jgi:eukaryotic-like serine/threonine-protein kinase
MRARLRQKLHPDMVGLLRRAIEVKPARRYRDGMQHAGSLRAHPPAARIRRPGCTGAEAH